MVGSARGCDNKAPRKTVGCLLMPWAHLWVRTWLWHGGQCTRVRQQGTSENSRRLISMSTDIELDANHGVS